MADDDLKTLAETIASLERLPETHLGRLFLNALRAITSDALEVEVLEGPETYGSLVWESIVSIGALADGKPRFHVYPTGSAADDLAARDAALAAIDALRGVRGDAGALMAFAARRPGEAYVALVRAKADAPDGPTVASLYRHPDVDRAAAVGWLKLTAEFIRTQDAAAAKSGS